MEVEGRRYGQPKPTDRSLNIQSAMNWWHWSPSRPQHTHTLSLNVWKCNKQNQSLRLYVGMSAIRSVLAICCCDADADVPDAASRSIKRTITGDCLSSVRSDRLRGHCSITRRNDRTHFRSAIRCPMPHTDIDQAPGPGCWRGAAGPVRDNVLCYDICYRAAQYVGYMRSYDDPGAAVTLINVEIVR